MANPFQQKARQRKMIYIAPDPGPVHRRRCCIASSSIEPQANDLQLRETAAARSS